MEPAAPLGWLPWHLIRFNVLWMKGLQTPNVCKLAIAHIINCDFLTEIVAIRRLSTHASVPGKLTAGKVTGQESAESQGENVQGLLK